MEIVANPAIGILLGLIAAAITVWLFHFWPPASLLSRVVLGPILSLSIYWLFAWPFFSISLIYAFVPIGEITAFVAPIIAFIARRKQEIPNTGAKSLSWLKVLLLLVVFVAIASALYFSWLINLLSTP